MAKKKTAPATIEEKMEAALVPVEEQPYPVPGNWCWVHLQDVCTIPITDGTHKTPTYTDAANGIPFISSKDVTSQCINWENIKYITPDLHKELYARISPQNDDVLLAKNGTTGVAAIVDTSRVFDIYVTLALLRSNVHMILPRYLLNIVNSSVCKRQFNDHLTGIGVPNLHLRDIKATVIPLPPLAEQRRIVDRIESLFAKLDEAKEKAQAVIDGYEERKAAILHRAFTGELTANVRAERGVGLDIWKKTTLGDIVTGFKYGTSEKSDYSNAGTPVFRIPNIGDGIIDFTDMKCLAGEADESYLVYENDVLIIRSNGSRDLVGKCAIIPKLECRYAYASFLIKIVPSDLIRPDYLVRFLNSSEARTQMFTKAKSSSGIHNINSKELGSITINLPEPWEP